MSQHDHRAARHEAEIRKTIDADHREFELEQAKQRESVEKFNEKSRQEHHEGEKFAPKED